MAVKNFLASGVYDMPVTIEIDATLGELMLKVGCPQALVDDAVAAHLGVKYSLEGVTVTTTPQTTLLESAAKDFAQIAQLAPIKVGTLQSILSGKLPPGAIKDLAKIHLEKAVKKVLASTSQAQLAPVPAFLKKVVEGIDPVAVILDDIAKAQNQIETTKASDMKKAVEHAFAVADSSFPFKALMAPKVQLPDATMLYQPVFGTDSESLYHCIALSPKFKVAIRVKSDVKVSIRVAGDPAEIAAHSAAFQKVGLTPGSGHCSVHLSTGSADLTRKSVGAILYGLGIPFTQVATDLTPIWGKGI